MDYHTGVAKQRNFNLCTKNISMEYHRQEMPSKPRENGKQHSGPKKCVKSSFKRSTSSFFALHASALLAVLALTALVGRTDALSKMSIAHYWTRFTFTYESEEQRRELVEDRGFVEGEGMMWDADLHPATGRQFVTLPMLSNGIPVTLATIENNNVTENPLLVPYPDWSWHANNSGCDGMTSVYRIHIDRCGRLWVPDGGLNFTEQTVGYICPPQLLVFDLATNQLIARHRFPMTGINGMLAVVAEQMGDTCSDDVYGYVSDAVKNAVMVYHLQSGRLWQVDNPLFFPDINTYTFKIAGSQFFKVVGILGMALSPCLDAQCDRYMFFRSFSGYHQGRVRTSVLRNESLYIEGGPGAGQYVGLIGNTRFQSAAIAMSKNGILFSGHLGEYTMNCWNMNLPYSPSYVEMVDYDCDKIRMNMGTKVVANATGVEAVIAVSNNIQEVFGLNFTPFNSFPVYILEGMVEDLIQGTLCDPQRASQV